MADSENTTELTSKETLTLTALVANSRFTKINQPRFAAILQRAGLNTRSAPEFWEKLRELNLIEAPAWSGKTSRIDTKQSMALTTDAYALVLPRLKESVLKKVWLPVDDRLYWSEKQVIDVFRSFLTNTARINAGEIVEVELTYPEQWGGSEVAEFITKFRKIADRWIVSGNPAFASARRALPKSLQSVLWRDCIYASNELSLKTLTLLKTYSGYFKNEASMHEHDRRMPEAILLFMEFLMHGHPEEYIGKIGEDLAEHEILASVISLRNGRYSEALRHIRAGLKLATEEKFFYPAHENWLYGVIVYLNRESPSGKKAAETILKNLQKRSFSQALPLELLCRLALLEDAGPAFNRCMNAANNDAEAQLMLRLTAFHFHILDAKTHPLATAETRILDAFPVLDLQMGAARGVKEDWIEKRSAELGVGPLLPAVQKVEAWENALNRLIEQNTAGAAKALKARTKDVKQERVGYLLDTRHYWELTPRLQTSKDGVVWSAGRNIAMPTFLKEIPAMTAQDHAVASHVLVQKGWYGGTSYILQGAQLVADLAGHPAVYDLHDQQKRINIVKEPLQVQVVRKDGNWVVKTSVQPADIEDGDTANTSNDPRVFIVREMGDGSLSVITLTADEQRLVREIAKLPSIPADGEKKLKKLLGILAAQMPVESELVTADTAKAVKKGEDRVSLLITPAEDGFVIRAAVIPLEGANVACEPGKGLTYIAANDKTGPVQIQRDLKKEKAHFEALEKALAPLAESRTDTYLWDVDFEGCLKILEAARNLPDDVTVRWPEGEKFKVARPTMNFGNIKLSVTKKGQWFEVEGDMRLDGKTKLKIAELLMKIRAAKGRFIALSDTEYLALTDELKRRLTALEQSAQTDKKGVKLSVFQGAQIEELEGDGAEVAKDEAYRAFIERVEKTRERTWAVPAGLTAELRDYQVEGYEWLMRLAGWGAGALLSDDMGLGKTVQTIAALLARAKEGPQLVVVPTSVLLNWRDELTRFAPGLTQVIFNLAEDRSEALKKLKAGTVVLTTYGVMTGEIETLTAQNWTTVVFDEAHTVKNRDTKAFKAAVTLKADFRILLTGTPLQNRLSEIWALFEIAVPGLLGSFTRFTDRFVFPIERDKDRESQRLLKRIISPFILRRTKTDVLTELPEKTEVTVKVELSDEEKALYEQIREETAVSLETGEINPVQALAALTKLRQAACAPQLIDKAITIGSSKTAAFLTLADDLIGNGHRALVFSQFTSHLALIRKALDAKGIAYSYLDGAMSPAERIKTVDAFSSGDEPLFLISLKAGGTGLNLTAADYVIHLDPWWNPAVEDQASDRAYRIGQERPVTIYRLIAQGTVEEKILKLHSTKKSLADALLEGTDMTQRLGRKEILELLELAKN